jgi:hypothetical protein
MRTVVKEHFVFRLEVAVKGWEGTWTWMHCYLLQF